MRHFGLDEANRLVPILSRTFEEVRPKVTRLQDVLARLELVAEAEPSRRQPLEAERDRLLGEVQKMLQPLLDMGVEVKGADGLVDFRATKDGRTVYLCWKYGEPAVLYWHELDAGFSGRRPIRSKDEFAPTYLS